MEETYKITNVKKRKKWTTRDTELQIMVSFGVIFLIVFNYLAMFGLVLAFIDADNTLNIWKAVAKFEFVGFNNFKAFFNDVNFWNILLNTIGLNVISLLINFPLPIIFALLINELRVKWFKTTVQFVTYLPHFLSWAAYGGLVLALINADNGVINGVLVNTGVIERPINFVGEPQYFWAIIIISNKIKGIGWGSIIYLAAIAGIPAELYEAAKIDGANRGQLMLYITLPSIAQTITLFLLLNVSSLLNNGTEQILMFQNSLNLSKSEVIDTYVLNYGLGWHRYSYATAIGLFKSIVSITLMLTSNTISKKFTGRGII